MARLLDWFSFRSENLSGVSSPRLPRTGLLARDNFRIVRHPSRVDAKRGDHFPQADLSGVDPLLTESITCDKAIYQWKPPPRIEDAPALTFLGSCQSNEADQTSPFWAIARIGHGPLRKGKGA